MSGDENGQILLEEGNQQHAGDGFQDKRHPRCPDRGAKFERYQALCVLPLNDAVTF